jgi:hypothetical protein
LDIGADVRYRVYQASGSLLDGRKSHVTCGIIISFVRSTPSAFTLCSKIVALFPYRTKSAFHRALPKRKIPNPSSAPSIPRTHHKESSPYPAYGRELPPPTPPQTRKSTKRGFAKTTSNRNFRFSPLVRTSYAFLFWTRRIGCQSRPRRDQGTIASRYQSFLAQFLSSSGSVYWALAESILKIARCPLLDSLAGVKSARAYVLYETSIDRS